jgi:hypothetical protein
VYFYKRACPLGKGTSGCRKMKLPKKEALPAEEVYCDEAFYEAIRLAAGPVQALSDHAAATVEQHLTAERPKRERKPRTFF